MTDLAKIQLMKMLIISAHPRPVGHRRHGPGKKPRLGADPWRTRYITTPKAMRKPQKKRP